MRGRDRIAWGVCESGRKNLPGTMDFSVCEHDVENISEANIQSLCPFNLVRVLATSGIICCKDAGRDRPKLSQSFPAPDDSA
jgi:hypothetical protein